MLQQLFRFGLVGAAATFVHMVIGLLLIQSGWHALIANTVAFVTAFSISFIGHLGFSFADQRANLSRSLWRFGFVGLIGFGCNQAILFGLTSFTAMSDTIALILSTGVTAIVTFILSRVWAFRADDIGRFPPAESDGELRTGYLKGPLA
jgi:putative flippase GtrA